MKAHGCIVFVNLFVIKLQQTAQDSSGKSVMLFIFSKVNLRERAKIELGWGTCMVQWWDSAILPPPFPPLPPSVPSFKIIYRTRENNESRIIKFGSVQLIIFLCVCVCRSQDLIASEYCSSKARAHSIHGYCHTTEWPASFEWFHHEGRIIEPSRNNPLTDQETDKKNNRVTEQPTTANHLTRQSFGQLVGQT